MEISREEWEEKAVSFSLMPLEGSRTLECPIHQVFLVTNDRSQWVGLRSYG